MTAYIVRRLLFGAVLIFLSTIVSFVIIQASPGMVNATDDPNATQQYIDEQNRAQGLDQPPWKQYLRWVGVNWILDHGQPKGILEGSLGQSITFRQPVSTVIAPRLLATLVLNILALLITWLIAIPLGTFAAARQYRLEDKVITAFSFIGMSLPGFFLAMLLLWLFASKVEWLPTGGLSDQRLHDAMSPSGKVLDYLHHLILPVVVLAAGALAGLQRITRANMVETLGQQFIVTARAKGVSGTKVIFKHALRNAINPLITLLGFEFAGLFGGAALLEIVINYPGMGQLLLEALRSKDQFLVMSVFLIASITLVLGNLLAELLLSVVDPRISHV